MQVSSNKAMATALSGGVAVATVSTSKSDVLVSGALTKATAASGLSMRYQDSSNYWRAYHDGTNCVLQKVVDGTPTTVISAAKTYSSGAAIVARAIGSQWYLFYNDSYVGSATDSALSSATEHGLYFADTDSTADNISVFAAGSGGEYAALENF
ncbi:MAG: hypothetical protein ABIN58_06125 [candidate division WOR-3 bacterium]